MPRPSADGPGAPPEARARGGAQSNGRPYLAQSNGRPYLARPQAERARTPPAQEERAAMAAAQSAAYRDAVEQWRRLEARQEERRQRLEARASQEAPSASVEDLAPPSATEPPAWVRAQGPPPAWAQRLEARVQAEEERSWGAPPDWGADHRPGDWASPREVELRLWLSANVGSPARRRAVLDVAECLDDLRLCEWDALEHHLALADWPALTRRRFVVAVRALRAASPPDSAAETLAYAWADDAEGGDEAWAARADAAAAANDRARRERVDAAIAAARAMPRARSESVSSESSDEAAARRRRRGDDAESDSDDESDGAMPPLEDAADGCVPPVPWRAESIVRRLAAAPPDEAACCPICLDALSGAVVAMPCRWLEDEDRAVPHAFHRDCALELLNASAARGERVPRCPTCRDDFPPHLLVAHPEDL